MPAKKAAKKAPKKVTEQAEKIPGVRSKPPPPAPPTLYPNLVPAIRLPWPPNSNNANTPPTPRPAVLPGRSLKNEEATTGPGTPASLLLVGPSPGKLPQAWTLRLLLLSYLPVLRTPTLRPVVPRIGNKGQGFEGWRCGKVAPYPKVITVPKDQTNYSAIQRNDEAWMVQERGFVALPKEQAKAATEAGQHVIPRCHQCTPGHKDEKKDRPFPECVFIYTPDEDMETWILRSCSNCFYNGKWQNGEGKSEDRL